jgi:hypothetical protein
MYRHDYFKNYEPTEHKIQSKWKMINMANEGHQLAVCDEEPVVEPPVLSAPHPK